MLTSGGCVKYRRSHAAKWAGRGLNGACDRCGGLRCASRAGIRTRDLPGNESCCYPSSLPASGSVLSLPVVFTLTLVLLNKQQIHSSGEVLRDLSLCAGSLGSDTTEGRIHIYTTWFTADCTSTSRQATVPVRRCTGTSRLLWYRY